MFGLRQPHMGGVAVVYRLGENTSLVKSIVNQNHSKVWFIPVDDKDENELNDISSTLIRRKLRLNEDCSHLTYKSVLEYLRMTPINN
jgi:nicotinic acid mononucleotide adenylyltransferase